MSSFWQAVRHPWQLIRPYCTPVRVAAALATITTPIAATVIAWLALQLAKVGVDLNATEALAVYGVVFTSVVVTGVTALRKFIDNRTQFETELIRKGKERLIKGKALAAGAALPAPYEINIGEALGESAIGKALGEAVSERWEPEDDVHISDYNPEIDDQPDELDEPDEGEDPDVLPERPDRV